MVVVAGAPKSGKTRTVLSALAAAVPDSDVWWAHAAPGVLPDLVSALERKATRHDGTDESVEVADLYVVLDDLHCYGTDPATGITQDLLDRLLRHARVIATVHSSQLAFWQWTAKSHGQDGLPPSITPSLLKHIEACAITLDSVLTLDEYPGALTLAAQAPHIPREDDGSLKVPRHLERLAEYLAAVDQLAAKAKLGLAEGGYRRAVVEAAVDAAVLYPGSSATPKEFEKLTKIRRRSLAPNTPWSRSQFKDALDWAMAPIGGPGSPHALVLWYDKAYIGPGGYRLLDGLIAGLSLNWSADHLLPYLDRLSPKAILAAGLFLFPRTADTLRRVGVRPAIDLVAAAASRGSRRAQLVVIQMTHVNGHRDDAAELAAAIFWDGDGRDSRLGLLAARLAEEVDDLERARSIYVHLSGSEDPKALIRLATLESQCGDKFSAEEYAGRAFARPGTMRDIGAAMVPLLEPERLREPFVEVRLFLDAAERDAEAAYLLGRFMLAQPEPPVPGLVRLLLKSGEDAGFVEAAICNGVVAESGMEFDIAREHYERAAPDERFSPFVFGGDLRAWFRLGRLAELCGDLKEAAVQYGKAARAGHRGAQIWLQAH